MKNAITLSVMKLALLVFISSSPHGGQAVAAELRPCDEVIKDFKARVDSREVPSDIIEQGLNTMQVWTAGGRVKSHTFDLSQCVPVAPRAVVVDLGAEVSLADLSPDALAEFEARCHEDLAQIAEIRAQGDAQLPNHSVTVPGVNSTGGSEASTPPSPSGEDLLLGASPAAAAPVAADSPTAPAASGGGGRRGKSAAKPPAAPPAAPDAPAGTGS